MHTERLARECALRLSANTKLFYTPCVTNISRMQHTRPTGGRPMNPQIQIKIDFETNTSFFELLKKWLEVEELASSVCKENLVSVSDECKELTRKEDEIVEKIKKMTGIENIFIDENPGEYPAIVLDTKEQKAWIDISDKLSVEIKLH